MTDSQRDEILNKLGDIDPALAESFSQSSDPEKWLKEADLEGYSEFTDNYESLDDFIGDRDKILAKLYQNLDGKMPSGARMQSFREKHPDISEEDIVDWFNKTNEYKKQYEQEREEEAGRIRRSREINEEWSLPKKIVSSGYEQERYIRDPKSATFGREASGITGSSIGSKADLVAGALAAAGDFVPSVYGTVIGPTIRLGRDVAHVVSDSPYQKSAEQILGDAAFDYGSNLAALGLANTRKAYRIAQNIASPEVKQALNFYETTENINKGIRELGPIPGGRAEDIIPTRRVIVNMPESPMKNELLDATKNWADGQVDWDRVLDIQKRYAREAYLEKKGLLNNLSENNLSMSYIGKDFGQKVKPMDEFARAALLNPKLSKSQKLGVLALGALDKVNTGTPGQIIFQQVPTVTGKRYGDVEDKYKRYDFNTAKAWYKKEYKRDFDLGFVPREGDDPAKIAAYEEYLKEKNK